MSACLPTATVRNATMRLASFWKGSEGPSGKQSLPLAYTESSRIDVVESSQANTSSCDVTSWVGTRAGRAYQPWVVLRRVAERFDPSSVA